MAQTPFTANAYIMRTLYELRDRGDEPLFTTLVEETDRSYKWVWDVVDQLEKQGFIKRIGHPSNNSKKLIEIQSDAEKVFAALHEAVGEYERFV